MNKLIYTSIALSMSCMTHAADIFEKPFQIEADNKSIEIEGGYAFPTFVDLNADGIKDLVVGGYANAGQIHYFEATKSGSYKKGTLLKFQESGEPLRVKGVK